MLAEAQRICFERAERPSVVNGDLVLLRITDAFSLSEADSQFSASQQKSPVCVRFAHLDWGYEKFSLRGWWHVLCFLQKSPRLYGMLPLDN
jgi:hypothetical protein